jgi:hypothetical protein
LEYRRKNGVVPPAEEPSVVITDCVFNVTENVYETRKNDIGGMMTKKYVAFCGYRCDLCPAYVKNVDKLSNRTVIRNGWKFFFGFDVPEERIMCVGCNEEGNHLDMDCPVLPCALRADVQNCSFCSLFESCDTLRSRADILDDPKKKFADKISEEEYKLFFRPYEGRKELKKQRTKKVN